MNNGEFCFIAYDARKRFETFNYFGEAHGDEVQYVNVPGADVERVKY